MQWNIRTMSGINTAKIFGWPILLLTSLLTVQCLSTISRQIIIICIHNIVFIVIVHFCTQSQKIIYLYNFYCDARAECWWMFSKCCRFDINRICKITEIKAASLTVATRTPGNKKIYIHNLKKNFLIYKTSVISSVKGVAFTGWTLNRVDFWQGGL